MTRGDVRTLEAPVSAAGRQAALLAFCFVRAHIESVSALFRVLRPDQRTVTPRDDRW